MAKVAERQGKDGDKLVFICDFSPPRGPDPALLDGARLLAEADFLSVAYSPGKSVRVDSAMAAHAIRQRLGRDVAFTIATRDMNKLAVQSHLLGAGLLGLDNVIVVAGDDFSERELAAVKDVGDFKPTELITAVKSMNRGADYRGLKLRSPTDFCVGATLDLSRDIQREARLTHSKLLAGADFFITQPVYDLDRVRRFRESYESVAGERLSAPLFVGLQIPEAGGLALGDMPEGVRKDLERGRGGEDIAIELLRLFIAEGITSIYLLPPVLRGGLRGYEAAQRVMEAARTLQETPPYMSARGPS